MLPSKGISDPQVHEFTHSRISSREHDLRPVIQKPPHDYDTLLTEVTFENDIVVS